MLVHLHLRFKRQFACFEEGIGTRSKLYIDEHMRQASIL